MSERKQNCGISFKCGAETRGSVIPIGNSKKPEEQTHDEWLADYGAED